MKLEDLAISRRGKLVVINHQKYQIEFNLSKGTWNYSNKNGKTIIKNAFTQIGLEDDTTLKSSDAGFREFHTEPLKTDSFGAYQTLRFSYETATTNELRLKDTVGSSDNNSKDSQQSSKNSLVEKDDTPDGTGIRIHTYLTCYTDHPYILLKAGVENLKQTPICLKNITLIDISAQHGGIQLGGHPLQYHLFLKTPPIALTQGTHRKIYDGFNLKQDNTSQPCQDGILHDTDSKGSLVFGFITTNKWWPRMQIGYQVKKRKSPQGLTTWALYHDCENKECQTGEEVTSEVGYLDFSEDVSASYKRYIERFAAQNGVQTLSASSENISDNKGLTYPIVQKTFSGWTLSSENIEGEMGADAIVEQTRSIAQNPLFKPSHTGGIDYIQLESGWQESPGNLSINRDRFPGGMTSVVEQIHGSGFKAGICIDPFSIEPNSELIQKYPEVCLRSINKEKVPSEDGESQTGVINDPVEVHLPGRGMPLAILDVSHPQTQ